MVPLSHRSRGSSLMAALLALTTTAAAAAAVRSDPSWPRCTTCVHPKHSWNTLPVSFHSADTVTGPKGLWTEDDLDILERFPLVTMEKWQGSSAVDPAHGNKTVFLWEEDAWINAAQQIKARNPNISVVAWMDTMLVYTGWNIDPKNLTVNTTLNPDANKACATGHFRPAEYLERAGRNLLLRNSSNQLALTSYGNCHAYDHSQPEGRRYWLEMCLNMTASGVIDGCGADFSATGTNNWADHTPAFIAKDMNLTLPVATAWAAGHRQMMIDTQKALGNGLLIGKDPIELGDHVNAVIQESGCYKRNATVNTLRNITQRAKAAGTAADKWVYQCHGRDLTNDTLAAFLAGAGDGHYLTVGGWYNGAQGHWSDDFARPLGPPLADATYNGTTWHREFASGTKVTFTPHINEHGMDMGGTGTIEWDTKPF